MLGEVREQVEPARAAVHDGDPGRRPFLLEAPGGQHPDALVAHDEVADAEHERALVGQCGYPLEAPFLRSTNFQPPAIDEMTPRPST
ncbi:MAG: hypothetical protein H6Q10_2588 [Acidobacteria bacterium]|nr:hypothetical protein [Acidobacteriota bacterium]